MTIASRQPITLALAEFEDIVSRGLQALIDDDDHLKLVAADISQERLAATLARLPSPTWRSSTSGR